MRRNALLASSAVAAVLAATAAGTQTAQASGATGHDHRVTSTHLISASGSLASSAVRSARAHAASTRLSGSQGVAVKNAMQDSTGATHVRLTRTYHGLQVLGGDLVVHRSASGAWEGATQTLRRDLTLSATPALGPAAALARVPGRSAGAPRLVVDATGATPKLAWVVTTVGTQKDGTPSRLQTYVDARTGALLRSEQRVETVGGDGQSLYNGTVPLQLTLSGTTYSMKDPTRGNTYTTDMNNTSDSVVCQYFGSGCKTGTTFTSTTPHFGNGTNSNRASAGADAQYGSNETWDYYKNVHGRLGIFGTGKGSYNRVHYGQNYVNAFWDGTKMTYGDGDGVNYGPLVSLDVAGHEMSHGVTENTAGLTYSGESGGLNEATSDIFGTMVEFFAANPNDPGDYLIGEEFDLKNHAGFRRMDNPIADGSSPNCYSTNTKNLDVHYSSGVANHFFYLLAEGSGAKTINGVAHNSPTCNGSTITGIGRDAAQRIWFRALTVYMTSGTTYSQARTATLNAATDLYGTGSTNYNTVAAAWSAVSVS
jgi:Zn-dependent metalloprotease